MNNDIENFPVGMSELRKLECLYAQHNNIQNLPDFVSSDNLKELHISNNYIKVLHFIFVVNDSIVNTWIMRRFRRIILP